MPIYEYQCDSCGLQRELILKPGEVARPVCTTCRKRMRRVISKTAFILKGSGWYVTDYPSDARKKGLLGEKSAPVAESAPAKKDSATAEKKTAVPDKKPTPPSPNRGGKSEAKKKK